MIDKGKKPGLGIMIAVGSPKKPPVMDTPGKSKPFGNSAANHAQETPEGEEDFHEEGGSPAPTPESVSYHTAEEACGNCEYFESGNCLFLKMPVNEGDWCKRFEARTEDEQNPQADPVPDEGAKGGEYE